MHVFRHDHLILIIVHIHIIIIGIIYMQPVRAHSLHIPDKQWITPFVWLFCMMWLYYNQCHPNSYIEIIIIYVEY